MKIVHAILVTLFLLNLVACSDNEVARLKPDETTKTTKDKTDDQTDDVADPVATPEPVSTPVVVQNNPTPVVTPDPKPDPTPIVVVTPTPQPQPQPQPVPRRFTLKDNKDEFKQVATRVHNVDILWVMDNSASMANNQAHLAENFESFINLFTDRDQGLIPSFQMAVITTDTIEYPAGHPRQNISAGRFVGQRVLTNSDLLTSPQNFKNEFSDLIKVGVDGYYKEAPLLAVAKALSRRENSSFFRDDALLVVNIISDENDASAELQTRSIVDLVNIIKNRKQSRVIINSIVNYVDRGEQSTRGTNQLLATQLTSGLSADILEPFDRTLFNIGDAVIKLTDTFPLTEIPVNAESIVVKVNGEVVNNWTYNARLNTISFDQTPSDGSRIVIDYQYKSFN